MEDHSRYATVLLWFAAMARCSSVVCDVPVVEDVNQAATGIKLCVWTIAFAFICFIQWPTKLANMFLRYAKDGKRLVKCGQVPP